MKKDKHPKYQQVLFVDSTTNNKFLCGAAMECEQTIRHEDGKEYPLCVVSISSASHPLFTGERNRFVDAEGRVGRFQRRYAELVEKRQKQADQASEKLVGPRSKSDVAKKR